MDEILKIFRNENLAAIGSFSSIVSLILTFTVFLGVRKIKRFYIFTARVPELNERLAELASKISSALTNESTDPTSITEILADAEVTLKSLIRKVSNPLKSDAKRIIKDIRSLEGCNGILCNFTILINFRERDRDKDNEKYEERIRKIYIDLYRLNAECRENYEDSRWEQ